MTQFIVGMVIAPILITLNIKEVLDFIVSATEL